jgi:hypothetical protein
MRKRACLPSRNHTITTEGEAALDAIANSPSKIDYEVRGVPERKRMPRKPIDPTTIAKWSHVSVKWEDAYEDTTAYNSDKFIDEYSPCLRHSIGWFLGTDGLRIFLTTTKDDEAQLEDGEDCEGVTVLPVSMILSNGIRVLTRRKKPKIKISPPPLDNSG